MSLKTKYKIIICWFGENHTFYTSGKTPDTALNNAITQLSTKLKLYLPTVRMKVFSGNRYTVGEVKEERKK